MIIIRAYTEKLFHLTFMLSALKNILPQKEEITVLRWELIENSFLTFLKRYLMTLHLNMFNTELMSDP